MAEDQFELSMGMSGDFELAVISLSLSYNTGNATMFDSLPWSFECVHTFFRGTPNVEDDL